LGERLYDRHYAIYLTVFLSLYLRIDVLIMFYVFIYSASQLQECQ